jgi:hypothetical protein
MANVAQTDLETLYTTITASTNVTSAQKAQSQGILKQLLVALFGPSATSSTIGNGANG